jgi:hypothetical protein
VKGGLNVKRPACASRVQRISAWGSGAVIDMGSLLITPFV